MKNRALTTYVDDEIRKADVIFVGSVNSEDHAVALYYLKRTHIKLKVIDLKTGMSTSVDFTPNELTSNDRIITEDSMLCGINRLLGQYLLKFDLVTIRYKSRTGRKRYLPDNRLVFVTYDISGDKWFSIQQTEYHYDIHTCLDAVPVL